MPAFEESTVSAAQPEEVWKLLYDPSRFPEWWAGVGSVAPGTGQGADGDYTMYPDGYPDFPMPQALTSSQESGTVKISCLVSDLIFDWRLRPAGAGGGTVISVHVELPELQAHRLETQHEVIRQSLARLAERAAAGS
jgi:uncharacterized protein YndB with AHSA1/START domain